MGKQTTADQARFTWIMAMLAMAGFAWIMHNDWPPLSMDAKAASAVLLVTACAGFLSRAFGREDRDRRIGAFRHWRACAKLYGAPLPPAGTAMGGIYADGAKLVLFDLLCETYYGWGCLVPLPWGFIGLLLHLVFRIGFEGFYENKLRVIDWNDPDAMNALYLTEPSIDAVIAASVMLYMFAAK